jgi:hypothetical protein
MLDVTDDWWSAIVIAAVCGGIGGLVYDLLLARFGDSGLLERPSRQAPGEAAGRKYFDVGFLASLLVGIVAAVGFLYFLTPEVRTVTDADGTSDVTRVYDPFKLVAASLIVGTGGAAFITAMRERLLKVVASTSLDNLAAAVQSQQEETEALVAAAADPEQPLDWPAALQRLQGSMNGLGALAANVARPGI